MASLCPLITYYPLDLSSQSSRKRSLISRPRIELRLHSNFPLPTPLLLSHGLTRCLSLLHLRFRDRRVPAWTCPCMPSSPAVRACSAQNERPKMKRTQTSSLLLLRLVWYPSTAIASQCTTPCLGIPNLWSRGCRAFSFLHSSSNSNASRGCKALRACKHPPALESAQAATCSSTTFYHNLLLLFRKV